AAPPPRAGRAARPPRRARAGSPRAPRPAPGAGRTRAPPADRARRAPPPPSSPAATRRHRGPPAPRGRRRSPGPRASAARRPRPPRSPPRSAAAPGRLDAQGADLAREALAGEAHRLGRARDVPAVLAQLRDQELPLEGAARLLERRARRAGAGIGGAHAVR